MMYVNKVLAAALAVQAGLAAVTWWPDGSGAGFEARPLVELDADAITAVTLTGRAGDGDVPEPLELVREDGSWVIASLDGYPADPSKVDGVLDKLVDLQVRAPLATQATSHRKLGVADDAFTRRVALKTGDEEVTVLLGAASGQSAHVRRAEEGEVYLARGFTAFSIPDTARRFYDDDLVDVPIADVTSLTVSGPDGGFTVEKDGDGWTAAELPEGMVIDGAEMDRTLRKLLKVRLDAPVGREREARFGLEHGVRVRWTATVDDASTSGGYTVGALEDGKRWVVRDDSAFVVRVSDSAFKGGLDLGLEDLLVEAPEPEDEEASAGDGDGATSDAAGAAE